MPIPKPYKYENKQDFVERCVADNAMQSEFTDKNRRVAVCNSRFRYRNEMLKGGRVKDVDVKNRVISGYLSTFNIIDSDNQVVAETAYNKTVKERKNDIFFLFAHSWTKILQKGYSVLQPDIFGLYYETKITPELYADEDIPFDDILKIIENGGAQEHSVHIQYTENNAVMQKDANGKEYELLKDVRLIEGSILPAGANPMTPLASIKKLKPRCIIDAYDNAKKALKIKGLHDKTYKNIESNLDYLYEALVVLTANNLKHQDEKPQQKKTNFSNTLKIL